MNYINILLLLIIILNRCSANHPSLVVMDSLMASGLLKNVKTVDIIDISLNTLDDDNLRWQEIINKLIFLVQNKFNLPVRSTSEERILKYVNSLSSTYTYDNKSYDELSKIQPDLYILCIKESSSIYYNYPEIIKLFIEERSRLMSWNVRAKHIIFFETSFTYKGYKLKDTVKIFQVLKEFKIYKGIFLRDSRVFQLFQGFVWLPYKNSCDNVKYIKQIINWKYIKMRKDIWQIDNLNHHWEIPNNLNQCQLKISTFHWPPFMILENQVPVAGIELKVIQTIVDYFNMTMKILLPEENRWEGEPCDANWGALLGHLHYQMSDLAVASLSLTKQRRYLFDHSISYLRTSLGWIIREAEEIPKWKNPFRIFNPTAWSLLFLSYHLTNFLVYIKYKNMSLKLFGILLGIAVKNERKFWLPLWILYSLIINMAYQTFLISFLTEPAREAPIKSLNEILNKNDFKLGFTNGLYSYVYLNNLKDWKSKRIKDIAVYCEDFDSCLERVSYDKNYAFLSDKTIVEYVSKFKFSDNLARSMVRLMDENILSYNIVLMMAKGFILKNKIDQILFRIISAGLPERWKQELFRSVYLKGMHKFKQASKEKVLNLSHLQGVFAIGFIGLLLSLFVFMIELIFIPIKCRVQILFHLIRQARSINNFHDI